MDGRAPGVGYTRAVIDYLRPQVNERGDEYEARLLVEANDDCTLRVADRQHSQGVVDYEVLRGEVVVGALEVGRNSDSRKIGGSARYNRYAANPIDTPRLRLKWSVMADEDAPWRDLANQIVELLESLEADGHRHYDAYRTESRRAGTARARLASLGVMYATGFDDGPHSVYLGNAAGRSSALDPNTAVTHTADWLASTARDPEGIRRKLAAHRGPERHAFVWVDRHGPGESVRPLQEGLPTQPPTLPPGITGLWIVGAGNGAFWSGHVGWRQVGHLDFAAASTGHWFSDPHERFAGP